MSRKADLQDAPPRLSSEKAEQVRASLETVLGSPVFRASRRCQILLRRIVEETVEGRVDSLKERTLGVELFGRAADYDTSQDPVVRSTAAEIRKKLAQYYLEMGMTRKFGSICLRAPILPNSSSALAERRRRRPPAGPASNCCSWPESFA